MNGLQHIAKPAKTLVFSSLAKSDQAMGSPELPTNCVTYFCATAALHARGLSEGHALTSLKENAASATLVATNIFASRWLLTRSL